MLQRQKSSGWIQNKGVALLNTQHDWLWIGLGRAVIADAWARHDEATRMLITILYNFFNHMGRLVG
jgi:hypothetical protein